MSCLQPNQRCVEQLAFVLLGEPEEQRGPLLVKVLTEIREYGRREGWSATDTLEFMTRFGDACVAAMHRHLEQERGSSERRWL